MESNMSSAAASLNPETHKYLKFKDYLFFSGAMFAEGALTGLMEGYLLIYSQLIIPQELWYVLGIIFLIVKVWDGVNDPIMGVIIDRTHTKYGKMRPYIMFTAVPFGLLTMLFFLIPAGAHPWLKLVLIFVMYLLWDVLSTLVDVPINGMYGVITPNSKERTKLVTVTRLLGSVGGEVSLLLYTVFMIDKFGLSQKSALSAAAIVLGVIAPILIFTGAKVSKERVVSYINAPKLLDSFRYLKKNKELILLLLSTFLYFFRFMVSASIIYVVTCIFDRRQDQILFAIPGSIASVLGMLLAPYMKKRFDSKTTFILSAIMHSGALLFTYVVGSIVMHYNMTAAFYVIAVSQMLAMLPVGLLNTVPTLMATDIIDYMELKTGERAEGITFSLMTLKSKIANGFKTLWMVIVLGIIGFATTNTENLPASAELSSFTKNGLFMMMTLIPAIFNLATIIPMRYYKLDGKAVEENTRLLAEKRAREAAAHGESNPAVPIA